MPSRAMLPVGGIQKSLTSTPACDRPSDSSPDGEPTWVIAWAPGWPNAPASTCEGQKRPSGAVMVAVALLSGVRLMGRVETNCSSNGGQSRLVLAPFAVEHGWLAFWPPSQKPPMHCGQGGPPLNIAARETREPRMMLTLDSPVAPSSVPLPLVAKTVPTQLGGEPV